MNLDPKIMLSIILGSIPIHVIFKAVKQRKLREEVIRRKPGKYNILSERYMGKIRVSMKIADI